MNNVLNISQYKGENETLATTDRQYTVESAGPAVLQSSARTKSWFRATQGGMALMSTISTNKISMSKFP